MNIHTEKLKLVHLLLNIDDPKVINKIKVIIESTHNRKDIWEELTDVQKKQLDIALKESLNNQTVDYERFIRNHRE